ncbi:WYL domain-containing protein [Chromatiaceae bacterium AAb-1]|nr:WYL domain-containing protein [Chromatiaceae bacterium AAb-1]
MFGAQPENRLWFIELIVWWEGAVNASQLVQQFNISRIQAQHDLSHYKKYLPENLLYNSSRKAWLPATNFHFGYISGDVVEYLNWVNRHDARPETSHTALPHTSLILPARQVSAEVMRVLVTAIRQQRRVEADYISVSNPDREGRVIVPHHFVSTGLRWHLRAFCEKSQQFRDFVLSRFRGTPELLEKSDITADQDEGWNTAVPLILKPDPRLTKEQQLVLEQDYQMQYGQLTLTTRGCLVQYLVQEMQINIRNIDISPQAQQLVLTNKDALKKWLFEINHENS